MIANLAVLSFLGVTLYCFTVSYPRMIFLQDLSGFCDLAGGVTSDRVKTRLVILK